MVLVVGGRYQGKLDFVLEEYNIDKSEVLYCDTITLDMSVENKKVIYGLNTLIKRLLEGELDIGKKTVNELYILEIVKAIMQENKDMIIISDEVGYGIVPLDKTDRGYRELAGRVCCHLAQKSDEVYRVVAGIATKIKG